MADLIKRPANLPVKGATVPPAVAFLAGFSGNSLRNMARGLTVIAELFGTDSPEAVPWRDLEPAHVKRIREMLSEKFAPATARLYFAAFRGVLKEANNPAASMVKGPKGSLADTGRALTKKEIDLLIDGCSASRAGLQLRALVAVTYAAGLRRFEVAALDLEDFTDRRILVRKGKGRKAREIALSSRAVKILDDWLAVRGDAPGPLFFGRPGERISASTVEYRLRGLGERAGVAHFTPHDLRRTFVTRILEKTGDVLVAQRLAGHASPDTTKRYDKRDQATLDAASVAIDD